MPLAWDTQPPYITNVLVRTLEQRLRMREKVQIHNISFIHQSPSTNYFPLKANDEVVICKENVCVNIEEIY